MRFVALFSIIIKAMRPGALYGPGKDRPQAPRPAVMWEEMFVKSVRMPLFCFYFSLGAYILRELQLNHAV